MRKISLTDKLSAFHEHWSPKIIGELNGQHVKLVKFQGEFVWHHHDAEDELFLVLQGSFRMDYREPSGAEQFLEISAGEFGHRAARHGTSALRRGRSPRDAVRASRNTQYW